MTAPAKVGGKFGGPGCSVELLGHGELHGAIATGGRGAVKVYAEAGVEGIELVSQSWGLEDWGIWAAVGDKETVKGAYGEHWCRH